VTAIGFATLAYLSLCLATAGVAFEVWRLQAADGRRGCYMNQGAGFAAFLVFGLSVLASVIVALEHSSMITAVTCTCLTVAIAGAGWTFREHVRRFWSSSLTAERQHLTKRYGPPTKVHLPT
jgi:protein-S-isoprenylcysteine O-methyltransferase Ste14